MRSLLNFSIKRRLALNVCLALFALGAVASTVEGPGSKSQSDLNNLVMDLSKAKSKIHRADLEHRTLLGVLYQMTKQKKKIIQQKGHLMDDLLAARSNAKNLEQVISQLEQKSGAQKERILRRLRTIHTIGKTLPLELLFSNHSIYELEKNLKFLKSLTEFDYALLKNYQENISVISTQRKRLEQEISKLAGLESSVLAEEKKLEDQYLKKNELLRDLKSKRKTYLSQIRQLKSTAKTAGSERIDYLIQRMLDLTFYEQRHRLPWPIEASVTEGYGVLVHPKFKYTLSHKGHYYQAPIGTMVQSVFDGRVVFYGSLPGYGYSLIVSHGDNYYTVYSNDVVSELKRGEMVKAGQNLGSVGSSKYRPPGLYFEIRHFSEPEDPTTWLTQDPLSVTQSDISSTRGL